MLKLENAEPPWREVHKLGGKTAMVYQLLWDSAKTDVRGDCGGTTRWTVKGIANELGIHRTTVASAIDKLLDCGLIQIEHEIWSTEGSNTIVWRVTHPKMLEAVRYAISIMGKPSARLKRIRTKQKKVQYESIETQEHELFQ